MVKNVFLNDPWIVFLRSATVSGYSIIMPDASFMEKAISQ